MKLTSYFTRDNARKIVTLKTKRLEWLYEAIREAHVSDPPNDWIYEECYAACEAIDDGSLKDDDDVHEFADSRVDIYTRDLFQWSADFCLTDTFASAESELSDCGGSDDGDMAKKIAQLQYFAIARIARTILEAYEANKDADDRIDTDTGSESGSWIKTPTTQNRQEGSRRARPKRSTP
jgi:hypothetical protein